MSALAGFALLTGDSVEEVLASTDPYGEFEYELQNLMHVLEEDREVQIPTSVLSDDDSVEARARPLSYADRYWTPAIVR